MATADKANTVPEMRAAANTVPEVRAAANTVPEVRAAANTVPEVKATSSATGETKTNDVAVVPVRTIAGKVKIVNTAACCKPGRYSDVTIYETEKISCRKPVPHGMEYSWRSDVESLRWLPPHQRDVDDVIPETLRREVCELGMYKCRSCGYKAVCSDDDGDVVADLIIPLAFGGRAAVSNMQVLCIACYNMKWEIQRAVARTKRRAYKSYGSISVIALATAVSILGTWTLAYAVRRK